MAEWNAEQARKRKEIEFLATADLTEAERLARYKQSERYQAYQSRMAEWHAEQQRQQAAAAYQAYRQGEREYSQPTTQPQKPWWQRAGDWLQQNVVQPVQDFLTRWSEPPNPSGPLFPKLQTATDALTLTALALDGLLTRGRLTQSAVQFRQSADRFLQNHPRLQNVLHLAHNLADFGFGFGSQVADDLTFGLYGRLTGLEWSNGSQAFQSGRWWGRAATNFWGQIEIAAGLGLALSSAQSIPPTAGGTAACGAVSGGLCLPLGGAALVIETAGVLAGTGLAAHGGAMLMRNAGNLVSKADDPTLRYGSNTGNTGKNANIFQRNMEEATGQSKPAGYHAHHIVPSTHKDMRKAREILEQWGIDINSAENGVFLPDYIHNGLANDKTYMRAVLNDLEQATSPRAGR